MFLLSLMDYKKGALRTFFILNLLIEMYTICKFLT